MMLPETFRPEEASPEWSWETRLVWNLMAVAAGGYLAWWAVGFF